MSLCFFLWSNLPFISGVIADDNRGVIRHDSTVHYEDPRQLTIAYATSRKSGEYVRKEGMEERKKKKNKFFPTPGAVTRRTSKQGSEFWAVLVITS